MFDFLLKLIPQEARTDIESRIQKWERDWDYMLSVLQKLEAKLLDEKPPEDPPHA